MECGKPGRRWHDFALQRQHQKRTDALIQIKAATPAVSLTGRGELSRDRLELHQR
jgi:hypothetical protein